MIRKSIELNMFLNKNITVYISRTINLKKKIWEINNLCITFFKAPEELFKLQLVIT